jgi:hypothetical protein
VYARVSHVDPKENHITIERETGTLQTYDPRRRQKTFRFLGGNIFFDCYT